LIIVESHLWTADGARGRGFQVKNPSQPHQGGGGFWGLTYCKKKKEKNQKGGGRVKTWGVQIKNDGNIAIIGGEGKKSYIQAGAKKGSLV